MKRILLFFIGLSMILGWTSCKHDDYTAFVGTWGVESIDYYNIDYAGMPIEATIQTYHFTPGDAQNGIDLIFRNDRTGEMRDRSRDTLYIPVYDETNTIIDTNMIVCPDTTLVTKFTYSYHNDDAVLYMNMKVERPYTYEMHIELLTEESFVYVNEYDKDYVEKARLIRLSNEAPAKATESSKAARVPFKPGTLFGNY
jgi:hypothetical protein